MIGIILSSIAVLLLLALSVHAILQRRAGIGETISISAFFLAGIEICDQLALQPAFDPLRWKQAALCFESLLPTTFLFSGITYLRRAALRDLPPAWFILLAVTGLFPASIFLFPTDDFFYAPDLQSERILFLGGAGYWFYIGVMLSCIIALMSIETAFSSTSGTDRWKIKFEVIGISGILSVLIFYFSQGLLYRTINMNLMPVRSGVFIIGAVSAGYSKLFRGNGVKTEVSRYIFYRSLTLLIVGLYLLVLGLAGEGMRYFDISFDRELMIFLAFASGILVLIVLLSENVRRKVKVFINKHFYAHKHDYREEWLNFTERLASCTALPDIEDAILATYKETFGLKGASLYILEKGKGKFVTALRDGTELEASAKLLAYFKDRNRVYNPFDGEYTPAPEDTSFVKTVGARLVVPLIANQSVEGLVVFGKQVIHEEFTYEDYDLMKTLARQAALSIMNVKLNGELIETREVAAMAKISSFVIHDLKNLTSALSLMLDNTKEYIGNPDFQNDMIGTIRATLTKMKNLMQRLKSIPEKSALHAEYKDIHHLSQETAEELIKIRPGASIVYHGTPVLSLIDGEEIKKVIVNLILNALEASGEKGPVWVETGENCAQAYIRVSDSGCGMPEDFIKDHLYKPFRTTKKKGLGIGLYQCRQIVEAHGGTIAVKSKMGQGTEFTVFLPVQKNVEIAIP